MSCVLFTFGIKSEFKTYEMLYKILKIRRILCRNNRMWQSGSLCYPVPRIVLILGFVY
jgi:hypothetical protein